MFIVKSSPFCGLKTALEFLGRKRNRGPVSSNEFSKKIFLSISSLNGKRFQFQNEINYPKFLLGTSGPRVLEVRRVLRAWVSYGGGT